MAVAGGLLSNTDPFEKPTLDKSYIKTGDGQYVFIKDGMEVADIVDHKHKPAEGWVVAIVESGDDSWELGPVPVTVNTWTIVVPRNQPVLLPISHFNALSDAVRTKYIQTDINEKLIPRSSRRFGIRAINWPKSSEQVEKAQERYEVIELNQ